MTAGRRRQGRSASARGPLAALGWPVILLLLMLIAATARDAWPGAAVVPAWWPLPWPGKREAPRLSGAVLRFAWPEYRETLEIEDEERLGALAGAVSGARQLEGAGNGSSPYWNLDLLWSDGSRSHLAITRDQRVLDTATRAQISGDTLDEEIRSLTRELGEKFFGEPLGFHEVRHVLPVGGTAEVRDLETGRTFRIYRHRGDSHADVEPLTAEDSRALKEVYGGQWSWKRRAVVLTAGGRSFAASMNGMPHGWGDIADNEFPGHFCIHFSGSRVHTTWRPDPGHQLMVLKAADLLVETLDAAPPEELARWVLAAVNHRDAVSLRHAADSDSLAGGSFPEFFRRLTQPIRHITPIGFRGREIGDRQAAVSVDALVYYHDPDPDRGYRSVFTLQFERQDGGAWRVRLPSLLGLVDRVGGAASVREPPQPGC